MTDVKDCTHDCEHSFRLTEDGMKCALCACILSPPKSATKPATKPATKRRAGSPVSPGALARGAPRVATKRAPRNGGKTK